MRLSFKRKKTKQKPEFEERVIEPNQRGFLFVNKAFERTLEPGIHKLTLVKGREYNVYIFSTISQWISVVNQTVLTQDNITLKLSYQIQYRIENEDVFRQNANFINYNICASVDSDIRFFSETLVNNIVVDLKSEAVNERRGTLLDNLAADIQERVQHYGVRIQHVLLTKITFPKKINDLFIQQFEVNVNAKIELEKVNNQVVKAKALNEVADLMRGNEDAKLLQMMDTMTKMAKSGNHTFVIGREIYKPKDKK